MVDIFDEVSEDLRAEQASRLARRYGGWLILLAAIVLLAVAAQQVFAAAEARAANRAATRYLAIAVPLDNAGAGLADAQRQAAAKALTDFAAKAPPGYRALARLRAAGLYAGGGQLQQADALWDEVAGDAAAPQLMRGLADLLWAQHGVGAAPDAQVAAHLSGITQDGSPWAGLARETQALLLIHQGQTGQAKALFAQIAADPALPDGVRNRADGMLAKLNG